jgi:acyl-CoA thioesterase-1
MIAALGTLATLLFFQTAAPRPELEAIQDTAGLPRILLIGDSISMGYTIPVRKALAGRANVHRIPENGGPTIRGLEKLTEWLGAAKWDVIHFNWGLHDLKLMDDNKHQVPLVEYERNLRKLVAQLRGTGARLIWASTTPVPDAQVSPKRSNSDVPAYNAVAARIMQENSIAVDDLYTGAAANLGVWQLPANVHFKPEGYGGLAQQVVQAILGVLR